MGIVIRKKEEARVFTEGLEMCREYFKTNKITFGSSYLLPGEKGETDWGHINSEEIFFVVKGQVLLEGESNTRYEMYEGDAALIMPETPHTLTNTGKVPALVSWSMAPSCVEV